MQEKAQISGAVERITYQNAENGYAVIRLKPDSRSMLPYKYAAGRNELITVVGNLPQLSEGEWLKLTGRWGSHPKHGRQFQSELCEKSRPATVEGIKKYLGSSLIKGVGPKMAGRIVDRFGAETLQIIDDDPERLREVLGIGKKRVTQIKKAWIEQRAIKEVMIFLQSHGISTTLAVKIYKKYGDEALNVVKNRPYQLVTDVHGIGFKTADKIAQALGLAHDDPSRIEAGVAYTLNKMANDGHVYMPQEELEPEAEKILEVKGEKITAVISQLESSDFIKRETLQYPPADQKSEKTVVREERAVYLTPMYYSEIGATNRVKALLAHPTSRLAMFKRPFTIPAQSHMKLADQQAEAVKTAVRHKVTILTGGPGTGKTTTLRALLDLLNSRRATYALASPTGRAAKRLAEATGREAKTIHRLLEFKPGEGFSRNKEHPLNVDMVIIDEASMLDLMLANSLLKAIPADTHLLLVGDIDQLPSVGAGDVLADLIASGVTAVVRLQTIFRQAAGSLIIHNAHLINQGRMPETKPNATDFFIFVKDNPDEAATLLVDVVQKRIPQKFGLDGFEDVQVLSPMYNGSLGVRNLNQLLQAALNPPHPRKLERRLSGTLFRVGDKVMQTSNNYDKNVYNGDIGRIVSMNLVDQTAVVSIDGNPVIYDFLEMDELVHAFAISVHKSQGAEYPCVVLPMATQHYMMLQRNLLYTAVTRARKLLILIGTRKAIRIAIRNNDNNNRHTALDLRLKK